MNYELKERMRDFEDSGLLIVAVVIISNLCIFVDKVNSSLIKLLFSEFTLERFLVTMIIILVYLVLIVSAFLILDIRRRRAAL